MRAGRRRQGTLQLQCARVPLEPIPMPTPKIAGAITANAHQPAKTKFASSGLFSASGDEPAITTPKRKYSGAGELLTERRAQHALDRLDLVLGHRHAGNGQDLRIHVPVAHEQLPASAVRDHVALVHVVLNAGRDELREKDVVIADEAPDVMRERRLILK